jgi:hypothetical protein
MKNCGEARAHETRSSINFLKPSNLCTDFVKPVYHILKTVGMHHSFFYTLMHYMLVGPDP